MWVDKQALLPVTIECYAASGLLLKTLRFKDIKDFGGGIKRPATLETDSPLLQGLQVGDAVVGPQEARLSRTRSSRSITCRGSKSCANEAAAATAALAGRSLSCWLAAGAQAAEEYSFDASAVREEAVRAGRLRRSSSRRTSRSTATAAFYKLGYLRPAATGRASTAPPRRCSWSASCARASAPSTFARNSDVQRDQLAHDHDNSIYEAAYSIRPEPGLHAGSRQARAQAGARATRGIRSASSSGPRTRTIRSSRAKAS